MDKKKQNTASNAHSGAKAKQIPPVAKGKIVTKQGPPGASASSNNNTVTKVYSHGNSSSTPGYVLFWLDSNIDMKNDNCRRTITELQAVISTMHVFNNSNECENFLHTMKNQNVFMVASGSLGQDILNRIHPMPQLKAVFIYCGDMSKYESLMSSWPKVRGVFTDITILCNSLKRASRQWDEESIEISLVSTSDISGQRLDQLDQSFMYTQLTKEILLELEYNDEHFNELVAYCRDKYSKDRNQMPIIQLFQNEYRAHTPICWYSRECFLYHLLNAALRNQESDIIIKMGFFICALHRHIEKLHQEQKKKFPKVFTVFRGHGMSLEQLEKMKKTKGGLLSFNNFLSTSSDEKVAMDFVDRAFNKGSPVAAICNITVDPSVPSAPYASLADVSYYGDAEKEILFSMHTIFRIRDIKQDNDDTRLWHVDLILTSDNDQQLNHLLERMREEIGGSSPSYRLGALMIKLGNFKKAEEVYKQLLEHRPDGPDKANLCFQLGYISDNQGEYDKALAFYDDALTIYKNHFSPNHRNIASCYSNMGLVYDNKKDYKKALSFYQNALKIYQETLSADDPNIGNCYNSIGLVHNSLRDYTQALSFCKQALDIFESKLPPTHPMLATSYNNIGLVYANMKKYSEAQLSYKHAVDIGRKALPDNHPDLAAYRKNLETVRNK